MLRMGMQQEWALFFLTVTLGQINSFQKPQVLSLRVETGHVLGPLREKWEW